MNKRYLAEFLGTFGIVFAPVALSASSSLAGAANGLFAAALISGLAVSAMIYALGPISAAHFNPAVTIGFAAAGRFSWKFVAPYIASQFAGAISAAGVSRIIFGSASGTHIPSNFGIPQYLLLEVVLTFLLMFVIIAVATDKRINGAIPGLAIGLTVIVCVLIGGAITGGSMNPARSLGPAVVAGSTALSWVWIYLIAPPIGAILAAKCYELIRLDPDSAVNAPEL